MEHTYYIPRLRKVFGTHSEDRDVKALLYATYMRHASVAENQPALQDGCSLVNGENVHVKINMRLRTLVGSADPDNRILVDEEV